MYKGGTGCIARGDENNDECAMEEFGTLDNSEKTFAILGNTCWPQAAKQEGDKSSKTTSTQCMETM